MGIPPCPKSSQASIIHFHSGRIKLVGWYSHGLDTQNRMCFSTLWLQVHCHISHILCFLFVLRNFLTSWSELLLRYGCFPRYPKDMKHMILARHAVVHAFPSLVGTGAQYKHHLSRKHFQLLSKSQVLKHPRHHSAHSGHRWPVACEMVEWAQPGKALRSWFWSQPNQADI